MSKVSQGAGPAQSALRYGTSLPNGLTAGSFVGQGDGVVSLLMASRKKISADIPHFVFSDLKRNAKVHKKFSLNSSWAAR